LNSRNQTVTRAPFGDHRRDVDHAAAGNAPNVRRMVEDIVGCKWSLEVLSCVQRGIHRPGAMEHSVEGLSKKVLNERLAKLVRYGILEREAFAELPPRVEYRFTTFGTRFQALLAQVERLQAELDASMPSDPEPR
jgi:DNA-binding HxlR family transcriptional regulator